MAGGVGVGVGWGVRRWVGCRSGFWLEVNEKRGGEGERRREGEEEERGRGGGKEKGLI